MFKKTSFFTSILVLVSLGLGAQKDPFSQGIWTKIGVTQEGIYQVTASQLQQLGYSLPIKSANLQIFGLIDSVLVEKVPFDPKLNVQELSMKMVDGDDGNFDNNDYFLFYHPSNTKHQQVNAIWKTNNKPNADTSFYFITVNQTGKRITKYNSSTIQPTTQQTTYTHHYYFETDSISLLNSGKLWLGAPMGQGIGKLASQNYNINMQGVVFNQPMQLSFDFWATAYQNPAQFNVQVDNKALDSFQVANVSGMLYDATALHNSGSNNYTISAPSNLTNVNLQVSFNGSINSTGWINYIGLHAKRSIGFYENNQIRFALDALNAGDQTQVSIANGSSSGLVWVLDAFNNPKEISSNVNGNAIQFNYTAAKDDYFVATKGADYLKAWVVEKIPVQQLEQFIGADYLIITPNLFEKASNQLANFYTNSTKRLQTKVVPVQAIYNVFGGGKANAIAIRNFLKFVWNQANQLNLPKPQYVLLMGMGNFDYKHFNPATQLPVFESENSNEILNSYTSDDFFACLQNGQDFNIPSTIDSLNIAIGRLPVRTSAEADTIVKKIISYQLVNNRGSWQRELIWVADDGDYNLHLQDADGISNTITNLDPIWNHKKMYLDLYAATPTSTGNTYPNLINELKQRINNGAFLLNYTGHGNYLRLTEEAVIASATMNAWNNVGRNPIMVTASCDFGPIDQPQLNPIAWDALMHDANGIIGLVAASRLVFAYSNKQINDLFAQQLLLKQNGKYQTIGQALQNAKRLTWSQQGDKVNAFKFNLMGDPAMELPFTTDSISSVIINKKPFNGKDTIEAGTKVIFEGNVFNATDSGKVEFVVYDQTKLKNTLANSATSMVTPVAIQEDIIYKGVGTIQNGKFYLEFIMPREINALQSGLKWQCFASSGAQTAWWSAHQIYVKPNLSAINKDTIGPKINAYIRNPDFSKNHFWTVGNEPLYIFLKDTSGIQSTGNVLGHDIELYIDQQTSPFILNQYYVADLNTYQSGSILFNLPLFDKGNHQIEIRAWDLMGNSSRDTLFFTSPDSTKLKADQLRVFPNPIRSSTKLVFDLSFIPQNDPITLTILDLNGKIVFSNTKIFSAVSNNIEISLEDWAVPIDTMSSSIYIGKIVIQHKNEQIVLTNKLVKM